MADLVIPRKLTKSELIMTRFKAFLVFPIVIVSPVSVMVTKMGIL